MSEQFDVIVIGMGPGGEAAASRLLEAGLRVAMIERELIGAGVPGHRFVEPEARAGANPPPRLG